MTTRDVGQDDLASTVTVPGPVLRSRQVETEEVPDHAPQVTGLTDELRCPACGGRFPGIATHCPDDGVALEPLGGPDA